MTKSDRVANLVLVLDRKAAKFPAFFRALFRSMFAGNNFVDAWVDLAPQGPVPATEQGPAMAAVPKIPTLTFAPDRSSVGQLGPSATWSSGRHTRSVE
jgi:hypothetical protein